MGRPRIHDQATAEALLDAAEGLVMDGATWPSVRAVAEAAGTTTRAIYSLFGSKEGLAIALATRGYQLLASMVAEVGETDDPIADLVAAGLKFRQFAIEHPNLFRLTFERVPAEVLSAPGAAKAGLTSFAKLQDKIRRAQDSGVLPPDRPTAELGFIFHSVCQGLASCELAGRPPPVGVSMWFMLGDADMEQFWREALTALLTGLCD